MEPITYDIATLGTIVAALVGVVKGLGMPVKYAPLVAMGLATVFVFIPDSARQGVMQTAIIGLIATGAYSYVKPKEERLFCMFSSGKQGVACDLAISI